MPDLFSLQILIAGGLIGAAAGLLGSFALLRRMALVGDALSHVALPGIALALIFNLDPLLGAFVFLLLGTAGIWFIEHKTKLPVDTLVGVFFALALAIGALLASEEELLDALFGDITKLNQLEILSAVFISLAISLALILLSRRFTLTMISTDLARSTGLSPHRLEFVFLLIFALTVAVGIKFGGALLTGSLVVIPAATARNLTRSMNGYLALSVILGFASAVLGIFISVLYGFAPGPTFVLISGAIFFLSVFFRR